MPKGKVIGFNGMDKEEWISWSYGVWGDLRPDDDFGRLLAERVISLYSKEGNVVLDPFAGRGGTLRAALFLNRPAVGIELKPELVVSCHEGIKLLEDELFGDEQSEAGSADGDNTNQERKTLKKRYHVFTGSCMDYLPKIPKNSVDLIISVLPQPVYVPEPRRVYFKSKEQQEEEEKKVAETKQSLQDKRDISIYNLQGWSVLIEVVLKQLYEVAKPESYCCLVVNDYREYKNDRLNYIPLHSVLFTIAESVGFRLHDIAVIDFNSFQELKASGFPKEFCFNLNHSYLIVLKKVL